METGQSLGSYGIRVRDQARRLRGSRRSSRQTDSKPRKLSPWLSGGVILLLVAILERDRGLSPILLGAIGVWWMSADIARIFPGLFLRRYYRRYAVRLGLENNKYRASINQRGFQVDGEEASWRVRWQDASPKGEDADIFMFYARGTLFIFAKRFLVDEQQRTLRAFAGLPLPH